MTEEYEYAGFIYLVRKDETGKLVMLAKPGQHRAAYKEKHIASALECYKDDAKRKATPIFHRCTCGIIEGNCSC